MTTYDVTPATQAAAMKAAMAGDLVRLGSGDYGDLSFRSLVKTGGQVNVEPAPGAAVAMRSLTVSKSEGLALRGLALADQTPRNAQVLVANSTRVLLEGFELTGETTKTAGVWARFNTDVTIRDVKAHGLRHGIFHEGNVGFLLEGGDLRDLCGDAVRGGLNSDGVTLRRLAIADLHQVGGDHLDAIQFWTTAAKGPTKNVLIEDVVYRRGTGDPAQGVLVGDEAGVGYPGLIIRRVAAVGGLYNGISVSGGANPVIEDCFVQPMEGAKDAKGKAVTNVWIQTRGSTGGQVADSFGSLYQGYQNTSDAKVSGWTTVPMAKAGDYSALDAWLKRRDPPADPRDAAVIEANAKAAAAQAELEALRADLKGARAALDVISADRDDDRAALAAIRTSAEAALASYPQAA